MIYPYVRTYVSCFNFRLRRIKSKCVNNGERRMVDIVVMLCRPKMIMQPPDAQSSKTVQGQTQNEHIHGMPIESSLLLNLSIFMIAKSFEGNIFKLTRLVANVLKHFSEFYCNRLDTIARASHGKILCHEKIALHQPDRQSGKQRWSFVSIIQSHGADEILLMRFQNIIEYEATFIQ